MKTNIKTLICDGYKTWLENVDALERFMET
jgi:hypothetical protein